MLLQETDIEIRHIEEKLFADEYNVKMAWKDRANAKINTVEDTIFYILLRSTIDSYEFSNEILDDETIEFYAEDCMHFILEAFTPITNRIKLLHGRKSFDTPVKFLKRIAYEIDLKDSLASNFNISLNDIAYGNMGRLALKLSTMF